MRRLGRDTLIYGLGQILGRLASVIMLPIYTRLLSPSDYGLLELLNMTVDVVAILVSAGTTAGVMRLYHKLETTEERHRLLASAHWLQLGLNLAGTLLLCLCAPLVHRHLLGGAQDVSVVYIAALNFTLTGLLAVPMLLMQLQGRAGLVIAASTTRLVLQLSLNILFLVGLHLGPKGILLSNMVATAVVALGVGLWMLRQTGLQGSRSAARELRRFGVPYQFTTAGTFVLTFGDRYFLERTAGLADVGIYALSYNFGFLLAGLTYIPFITAWTPQRHALAAAPRQERDTAYNRGLLLMSLLTIAGAMGIALFVRPVLQVMSGAGFHAAAVAVPLILVAMVLQAWTDVVRFNIDVSERTLLVTQGTWLSVIVVLLLYATLIPLFGAVGAALATALAFLARLLLFQRFADQVWPVAYDWMPSVRLLAGFGVVTACYQLIAPEGIVAGFGAATVGFAAWTGLAIRELPAPLRRAVFTNVRSPRDLVQLLREA